jgi:hypothetical protein
MDELLLRRPSFRKVLKNLKFLEVGALLAAPVGRSPTYQTVKTV